MVETLQRPVTVDISAYSDPLYDQTVATWDDFSPIPIDMPVSVQETPQSIGYFAAHDTISIEKPTSDQPASLLGTKPMIPAREAARQLGLIEPMHAQRHYKAESTEYEPKHRKKGAVVVSGSDTWVPRHMASEPLANTDEKPMVPARAVAERQNHITETLSERRYTRQEIKRNRRKVAAIAIGILATVTAIVGAVREPRATAAAAPIPVATELTTTTLEPTTTTEAPTTTIEVTTTTQLPAPVTTVPRPAPKAVTPQPVVVNTADANVWDRLAQCESSGNWSINTGNGYYGGLQFDRGTWLSNGGGAYAERADLATKDQQIEIASKLQAARGWSPWPACSKKLGLR